MRLVIDANILVAELIRQRGRELIVNPVWELYIPEKQWEESCYELNKRIKIMIEKDIFSSETGQNLLKDALSLAETNVCLIPLEFYSAYKNIALARIPRDPDDWQTVALALFLNAGIWTHDKDFLGCGMATWTTDTLISYLTVENN
ncbi:MAG: PIN domain-containing protein [Crocosphaera sp.]